MADLANFLRYATGGAQTVTPEMYDHFGGDDILAKLQKFDPNAKWVKEDIGGGEGGSQGSGFRLDVDMSKLPKSKAGTTGLDLRPDNFGKLINPNAVLDDDAYGRVTNSTNVMKPKDPAWTKYAPLVVSVLAPMAGAALAAGGIGGAAGMTAAATGSGLTGINAANLPDWFVQAIAKAPQQARSINEGGFNPMSLLPIAGQAAGISPSLVSGGMTLAQLARTQR